MRPPTSAVNSQCAHGGKEPLSKSGEYMHVSGVCSVGTNVGGMVDGVPRRRQDLRNVHDPLRGSSGTIASTVRETHPRRLDDGHSWFKLSRRRPRLQCGGQEQPPGLRRLRLAPETDERREEGKGV